MADPSLAIEAEHPEKPDIRALLEDLDAYLSALYPADDNFLLSVEELARPDVTFLVARRDGQAIGCGAIRRIADDTGEVKRMYAVPAVQGQGVGRLILQTIEAEARRQGLESLFLETGGEQPAALHLYQSQGYAERGPYLDYPDDGVSIFMEKRLNA